MLTAGDRLAHLEGRVVEHSQLFVLIESRLAALDQKLDQKLTALEQRFDQKLAALEQKFDQKLAALEQRFDQRLAALELEIATLRRDMTSQFRWTMSMILTGFIAIFAAIIAK